MKVLKPKRLDAIEDSSLKELQSSEKDSFLADHEWILETILSMKG